MKIITDEKLAELIVMLKNHQIMKVKNELLSLEDMPEQKSTQKENLNQATNNN